MTLQINMNPGRTVNGGPGVGLMTSAGNPWTVSDALAQDLVNRGVASPIAWPLQAVAANTPLMTVSRTGQMYGNGQPQIMGRKTLPGGAIAPGAILRMKGIVHKFQPFNGGCSLAVSIVQGANEVALANTLMTAALFSVSFEAEVVLSGDRKFGFARGGGYPALFQQNSLAAGADYSLNQANNTYAGSVRSPRGAGFIAFASYSAPPTVETVLIDFDKPVEVRVTLTPVANDCVELIGFDFWAFAQADGANTAHVKATLWPGDSYTEGTGATNTGTPPNDIPNDVVAQFGRLRPGRPTANLGLGGQGIKAIVDRIVADPIAGKYWDLILWAGANNATGNAADWIRDMDTDLQRLFAFRAPGSRTMLLNLHPTEAWFTPGTIETARVAYNAWLAAHPIYGPLVCDISTPLKVGGVNGRVAAAYTSGDAVSHLSNAGYAVVAGAADAKATALGWA